MAGLVEEDQQVIGIDKEGQNKETGEQQTHIWRKETWPPMQFNLQVEFNLKSLIWNSGIT
ncbi:putative pantothenate kinase 2 [Sesbania bispinosa]|nr:putative pantothenate kinase 2 [Sesbania bispinosa]